MERRKVKFAWRRKLLDNGDEVVFERYVSIEEQVGDKFFDHWYEIRAEEYEPPLFQDCNKLIQLWRYRWYLLIPFETIYYFVKSKENIRLLWKLSMGLAQSRMRWFYTFDSVDDLMTEVKKDINN